MIEWWWLIVEFFVLLICFASSDYDASEELSKIGEKHE